MGLPVDECAVLAQLNCANDRYATARCRPNTEADNRGVAGGEVGYFNGTTGFPVGLHFMRVLCDYRAIYKKFTI